MSYLQQKLMFSMVFWVLYRFKKSRESCPLLWKWKWQKWIAWFISKFYCKWNETDRLIQIKVWVWFWSQSGIFIEKVKFKMVELNFRKVLRSLFFLACLSFVLWQCILLMGKFLERPRSTSVRFDQAKNWPLPKFVICPTIKDDPLETCGFDNEAT